MSEKKESLLERMKKLPLGTWGMICIFGGLIANLIGMKSIETQSLPRSQERAAQIGNAAATILFIIVGVVLIIMHFIRKRRKK